MFISMIKNWIQSADKVSLAEVSSNAELLFGKLLTVVTEGALFFNGQFERFNKSEKFIPKY